MPRIGNLADGSKEQEQAEKRRKCLAMREIGYTYEEISQAMGWKHPSTAIRFVKRALKATYQEPADEVRKFELKRLDRLTRAIWFKAVGKTNMDGTTEPPDLHALDRLLKLMNRRAALLGLDAPIKTDQKIEGTVSGLARVIVVEDDGRPTREPLANGLPTHSIAAGSPNGVHEIA